MTEPAKVYTPDEIMRLTSAVEGDKESFQWLMDNHLRELAALCDAVVNGKSSALEWLKKYGFTVIADFVEGVENDDKPSLDYLMENSEKQWSATACAILGDDEALNWLHKYNFSAYANLAEAITRATGNNGGGGGGGFGFGGGGFGSGGGGGGFGGFGGGSFGGGGGGGSW